MSGFIPGVSGSSVKMAGGVINVGGALDPGYDDAGITSVSNPSTGQFDIDFTAAGFTAAPFVIAFTVGGGASALRWSSAGPSATTMTITWTDPTTGTPTDTAFSFLAVEF
jgi:hypothetical protein